MLNLNSIFFRPKWKNKSVINLLPQQISDFPVNLHVPAHLSAILYRCTRFTTQSSDLCALHAAAAAVDEKSDFMISSDPPLF